MRKLVVSIVGRPNVGKSTLFNKIIGRRKAIVEDTPGVTRDRNYEETSWNDYTFDLIDTGGFEPASKEDMLSQMRSQTQLAVEESDVIIFLCDGKEGLMPADEEAINLLRKFHKPILPAVNKIDDPSHSNRIYDFAGLGFGEIISVSAEHKLGISDLMDKVTNCLAHLPKTETGNDLPGEDTKIAIIGRPNVGKSTLINQVLKEKRLMVSPAPGTTRDPIDTRVEIDGKRYIFTDTAGIRRKGKVSGRLEKYCVIMAKKAMERSDIALLILDAKEGVTAQDSKIAGYAYEMGRGCIIVINKWDLVEKDHKTIEKYKDSVLQHMKYLSYAPVISLSSLTGQRVHKIFPLIGKISEEYSKQIKTSLLNKSFNEILAQNPPSLYRGKPVKFYYTTQIKTKPPTFLCFVNFPKGVHFSYERYLHNQLRTKFSLENTQVRIYFRERERKG